VYSPFFRLDAYIPIPLDRTAVSQCRKFIQPPIAPISFLYRSALSPASNDTKFAWIRPHTTEIRIKQADTDIYIYIYIYIYNMRKINIIPLFNLMGRTNHSSAPIIPAHKNSRCLPSIPLLSRTLIFLTSFFLRNHKRPKN